MTAAAPQPEFDFQIGYTGAWLTIPAICQALDISDAHASNLIADGSLDYVIDIRGPGATRPAYRVFVESYRLFAARQEGQKSHGETFDQAFAPYLRQLPSVLSSSQIASHLRCSDDHVLTLADYFADVSTATSFRRYLRASRLQLFDLIQKRRVQCEQIQTQP
jgi:hypothetical protein